MILRKVLSVCIICCTYAVYSSNFGSDTTIYKGFRGKTSDGKSADPIIAAIDSLYYLKSLDALDNNADKTILNTNSFSKDSIPIYVDLVYEYRLAALNDKTPLNLDYNQTVRKYIDLFTLDRRDQVARMLGLAKLYFPIFEEALDRYNLPLEIKYLAVAESALNPLAVSKSGAVGLWQFLLNSGSMFDLKVDSYIDERRDPYKSTEAACQYLEYLYRIFKDWELALAAYNGGPGAVRNAIVRSGGKTTLSEIRPYLSQETQNYVPIFIALNYVMNYSAEHNIHPIAPPISYSQRDTVIVKKSVSFNQIASVLNIPIELIRFLNPTYKRDYIPSSEKPMILILPINKVAEFLEKQPEIYSYVTPSGNYHSTLAEAGSTNNKYEISHRVKKGEYFHKLAIQYKCTIEDIKVWNNLSSTHLNTGQVLKIWVDASMLPPGDYAGVFKPSGNENTVIYYVVQEGDSIQSISKQFNGTTISQLKQINNIIDDSDVTVGEKIKIYTP